MCHALFNRVTNIHGHLLDRCSTARNAIPSQVLHQPEDDDAAEISVLQMRTARLTAGLYSSQGHKLSSTARVRFLHRYGVCL